MEQGPAEGVTSAITMLEVLVHPYRAEDFGRAAKFYSLLSQFPNLEWIPFTLPVADRAARLRAAYSLKTPDSIQAATAVEAGASGMITNDAVFHRVPGLDVLLIDDLLLP